MVDGLEQQGLAVRERDPNDRRRSVVRITAKGTKMLAKADAVAAGIEQGGLAGLDDEDRDQLLDLLQRAASGVQRRSPLAHERERRQALVLRGEQVLQ